MKKNKKRSKCPISRALDVFGDKWTLLIMRDFVFRGFHFYNEFLNADEGIATNILSDRLKTLEEQGFIQSRRYEKQKTKKEYVLTASGISTVPILLEMLIWGHNFDPDTAVDPKFYQRILADKVGVIKEVTTALQHNLHEDFC